MVVGGTWIVCVVALVATALSAFTPPLLRLTADEAQA